MRRGVVGEDDARIEQTAGIKQRLDVAHQIGGLLAPFHFHKGRHIATGAVFCFERSVVLGHHQITDIVHEAGIALHLGVIAKVLGKNKMQIALQGMAKDDGLAIAVLQKQRL